MKNGVIKGQIIPFDVLEKQGFNRNVCSYYVDAIVKLKTETVVFPKCKAIDMQEDGEDVFYFTEGDDSILLFKKEENPNMTIKRLFLN